MAQFTFNTKQKTVCVALTGWLTLLTQGCGYQAPLTAEAYNPAVHADHKVDLLAEKDAVGLYQLLKDTHEVFEQCGLEYWADGGTLLGAVRNGGLIPWDDDVDFAFHEKDEQHLLLLRPTFTKLGYFMEKVFFGYRLVNRANKAELDLFKMVEADGKISHSAGNWGTRDGRKIYIERTELEPIKKVSFGPVVVQIPGNPNPLLDAYFSGWSDTAFTYGHHGQRKFKIDLNQFKEFKNPGPFDPANLTPINVQGQILDRVQNLLQCPDPAQKPGGIPVVAPLSI